MNLDTDYRIPHLIIQSYIRFKTFEQNDCYCYCKKHRNSRKEVVELYLSAPSKQTNQQKS
jgi:hypothetical protein